RVVITTNAGGRVNVLLFERISSGKSEHARNVLRLISPGLVRRNVALAKIHFLRVEYLLRKAAQRAEQHKPRARRGGEDAGAKNRAHTVRIVQRNIKSIVGGSVFSFDSNVGRYGFRQTEKNESVVDQVRRDVE